MRGFVLGCVVSAFALQASVSFAEGDAKGRTPEFRLATLFRNDPLRCTVSLLSGENGYEIHDYYVRTGDCDLDFGNYHADALTIGTEARRRGVLIDLGSPQDLARRYGYEETIGQGQGFASIHFEADHLAVTRRVGDPIFQVLQESKYLLGETTIGATVPVVVGHVYLARIVDEVDRGFERIAKLVVVAHSPGQSVTLRWTTLRRP